MERKVPLAFVAFLALLAGPSDANKDMACPAAGAAVLDTPGRLLLQAKRQRTRAGSQPGESAPQNDAKKLTKEGQQSAHEAEKRPEEVAADPVDEVEERLRQSKERMKKELRELKKVVTEPEEVAAEPEKEKGSLKEAPEVVAAAEPEKMVAKPEEDIEVVAAEPEEVAGEAEEEKRSSKSASEVVAAEPATQATQTRVDKLEERLRQSKERMKKELRELKKVVATEPEKVAAEPAEEEARKKAPEDRDCKLPEGAVWCEARLQHLPPFKIATYAEGDAVSATICDLGHWEESNFASFGPPGNMLDAGAHIGYHTVAFAKSGWNVTAFEPMANNLALMDATLCRNPDVHKRIRINRFGLGAKTEKCEMVVPSISVGDGFMRCEDAKKTALPLRDEDNPVSVGEFDVRRLDEVLQEQNITQVDLVKVDVEGYEAQVFAGAPDFLRQYRPKVIKSEAWWKLVGPADGNGTTGVEYFDMFQRAGYKFFKDNACQIPFDPVEALDRGSVDVIMCLEP